jgi:hypothetical protein
MKREPECTLTCDFSLSEKLYAQISFLTMGVLGTIGIILEDWVWVIPYIGIYWYGIPGIVMRHLNCPRCPHLHVYGDCLQAPTAFTRWLVKGRKTYPYSRFERFLFYAIFILIPIYPIYWLSSNLVLLIPFLLAVALWYSGQFLHFCKRCRLRDCPFNRVTVTP